jgi:hypothetical protein
MEGGDWENMLLWGPRTTQRQEEAELSCCWQAQTRAHQGQSYPASSRRRCRIRLATRISAGTLSWHDVFHDLLHALHANTGITNFMELSQSRSYSRISQRFMIPEGSLPCSQEPSTGPYPKPDRSSPSHPFYLSKIHFNPPTYILVCLVVSFLLAFSPISYMHSSSPPFVLHALPISSSF